METIELKIVGMSCEHCSGRVEKALGSVAGVTSVDVILEPGSATVTGENVILDDLDKTYLGVMTLVEPMRFPRSKYLGLFLVGCLLAALGWGMQAYVDLVRLEAAVVDARARVETASRIRLELVENLLRDAQAGRRAEALSQVDLAAMRVRDLGLLPAALDAEGCPTDFLAAQEECS